MCPAFAIRNVCVQVTKFLVDDSEVGEWVLQGLPTDELSVQNGIMVTRASRYTACLPVQEGASPGLLPRLLVSTPLQRLLL